MKKQRMARRCVACDVLNRRKQRIGLSEIGTIGSKPEAVIPCFSPVHFGIGFPGIALRRERCEVGDEGMGSERLKHRDGQIGRDAEMGGALLDR